MTTTRLEEYLEKQATGFLDGLRDGVPVTQPDGLDRLCSYARGLSGTARLAGDDRLRRAASAIQRALRAAAEGHVQDDLDERLRLSVDELRLILMRDDSDDVLDARAAGIVARWTDADDPASDSVEVGGDDTFDLFVEREADGIADTMDQGLAVFAENPTSREWLGAILRRQRALLGSVRLDQVAVVAEALKAVEDLSELIVRLDVPVKNEWLDVFRCARDVLRSAAESLRQGEQPASSPALSRLRTLREELVDRYGDREPASQADAEIATRSVIPAAPESQEDDMRQRAAVLKVRIANALTGDPEAQRALDDLYAMLLSELA